MKNVHALALQFEDIQGDVLYLFPGDNRLSNSITYKSPAMGLFSFGASVIFDSNSSQKDDKTGIGAGAFVGDAALKKTTWYGTLGYESEVAGYTNAMIGGGVNLMGLELRALYEVSEAADSSQTYDGDDESGWLVNVAYPMGKWRLKAQYADADTYKIGYSKRSLNNVKLYYQNQLALGVDYNFTKMTQAALWYVAAEKAPDGYRNAAQVDDTRYIALGLIHVF